MVGFGLSCAATFAQEPANDSKKSVEKAPGVPAQENKSGKSKEEKTGLGFQIALLETRVRFEANGDSRKEVYTAVKINDASGARQFSRLGFDYNRAFQSVEIPLVKIAHANGGTSEILPSAIGDVPNPAVEKYPAYQNVRVKTVRILGLQEGDTLEYRVITTTTKHPLAPDFWLEHTFDRSGQVLEEHYDMDLPSARTVRLQVNPATMESSNEKSGEGDTERIIHHWLRQNKEDSEQAPTSNGPDVVLTTYHWLDLSDGLSKVIEPSSNSTAIIKAKAAELTKTLKADKTKLEALHHFVSTQIKTVDLPLGATGFRTRNPERILESGYGIAEDKFALLASLAWSLGFESRIALFSTGGNLPNQLPRPSLFVDSAVQTYIPMPPYSDGKGEYIMCDHCGDFFWSAPAVEVAPFGALPERLRGQQAFVVNYMFDIKPFAVSPRDLPFTSMQHVTVDGKITDMGQLSAKVKYVMRGDNELSLRMAFHQAPRERWNEVAGLLALSDGFRGHIESVKASDPMETEKPFEVEYEITQAKFVDWSKKPVRIPALLPQIALPEVPGKAGGRIELGTPLDVETSLTLRLPEGATVETPPATSVSRDYAAYTSKYDGHLNTLTAARHIHFLLREIPGERAADYNAFVRAVQLDQAQGIILFPLAQPEKK